jgi:hypothetical protein
MIHVASVEVLTFGNNRNNSNCTSQNRTAAELHNRRTANCRTATAELQLQTAETQNCTQPQNHVLGGGSVVPGDVRPDSE